MENQADFRLATEICVPVRCEHNRLQSPEIAKEKGWPSTPIHFKEIPKPVVRLDSGMVQLRSPTAFDIDQRVFYLSFSFRHH